jgi:hypothetical protein
MKDGPVFIGGLSYSGKTQLRLLLSTHPNIVITRHTRLWTRYYRRFGDLRQSDNFEQCLKSLLNSKHILVLKPDAQRIRQEFWQGPPTYERLFYIIHEHYAEHVGKRRWGDQLGGIERYAEQIFSAYPGAQMIHMIRDPRDRYQASLSSSPSRPGKLGWEIAQWLRSARLAQQNRRRYPDRYLVVLYEDLFKAPEKSLPRICSFLNEDATSVIQAMKDSFGDGRNRENAIISVLDANERGEKMSRGRSLSNTEMAFIQTTSKQTMSAFGYAAEGLEFSLQDWVCFLTVQYPLNLTSMMAKHTSYVLKGV